MSIKYLINILELQKEVFGDSLYENITFQLDIKNNHRKETLPHNKNDENYEILENKNQTFISSAISTNNQSQSEKLEIETKDKFINFENAKDLEDLYKRICDCKKCLLGSKRTKFVFGKGNPNAEIMLIGEAPGAEEDLKGEPFVGKAGELLTKILAAINLKREEVYIANIVKCRPPNNRNPLPDEISNCIPYLHKQIELIKPKFILCLGLIAANSLLNKKQTLSNYRGKAFDYKGAKVMVTFHPAALLRNPGWKRDCWEDVKKFREMYDEYLKTKGK